jgi:hypothetical protein
MGQEMPQKGGNCSKNGLIRSAQAACACDWLKTAVFRGSQKKEHAKSYFYHIRGGFVFLLHEIQIKNGA